MSEEISRSCNECTKCCEGWLPGSVNGYKFWPGRPCHYQAPGTCTIYETRPHSPCKSYKCAWLIDPEIPEWLKPSRCDAIITYGVVDGEKYVDVVEAGSTLDSKVLSWLFQKYITGTYKNISYRINSAAHKYGSETFMKAMNK